MNDNGQFNLLRQRRFGPFFWTQAFGAFNNNVYKNALVIMIAFQAVQMTTAQVNLYVNLAAGLFILPFFLGSSPKRVGDFHLISDWVKHAGENFQAQILFVA